MDEAYLTKMRLTSFSFIDDFVVEYMAKHGQDDTVQPPTEQVIRREFVEHQSDLFRANPAMHADFEKVLKKVLKSRSVLAKYWLKMRKRWPSWQCGPSGRSGRGPIRPNRSRLGLHGTARPRLL